MTDLFLLRVHLHINTFLIVCIFFTDVTYYAIYSLPATEILAEL